MNIRIAGLVALSLAMLGALVAYYPQLADDADIWWHLEYGRAVLRSLDWRIDHAAYSWTPADGSWIYVSWLGSLILYAAYRIAGLAGLGLLQWLVFGGIVCVYGRLLHLGRLNWSVLHVAILFLAGLTINPVALYIKPELFSHLMFAAVTALFFAVRLTGMNSLYWIYAPLFLVWVNIHGGFVYGLAFLGLAWCAETLCLARQHEDKNAGPAWKIFTMSILLAAAATLVNPHGWHYWAGILENALSGGGHARVIAAYAGFQAYLVPPPFEFRKMNAGWGLLIMLLSLAGLMAHVYVTRRKFDRGVALSNLVFFTAGFFMIRASGYFVVLWMLSVVYIMASGGVRVSSPTRRLCLAGAAIAAVVILAESALLSPSRAYWGRGTASLVPDGAVEFTRRNSLPAPLFNDYTTGGYLIWALYPDYKVFIDPRYGPYVKTGVWDAYARLETSGSQEMLAILASSYGFQSAIISTINAPSVADLFLFSPRWRMVYFDAAAAVFVKMPQGETRRWQGDMTPQRFAATSNPDVLARLFALYCLYNPADAAVIRDIYARNVSKAFVYRKRHLAWMQETISRFHAAR